MIQKLLLIFACCAMLQGCASTKYVVDVSSLSAPSSQQKMRYTLLPGNKKIEKEDLQFLEYGAYIDKALALRGYTKVELKQKPDLIIFLQYGIGSPQSQTRSYSLPTYGQTGVASSTTYGTVNTYGGMGTYSGTTTYQPTYGITGSRTYTENYTTYFRFMIVDAVDFEYFNKSKKIKSIWKTKVTSTGSSNDLREVFPILVAASKEHFGKNTGRAITVEITPTDSRLEEIKPLP